MRTLLAAFLAVGLVCAGRTVVAQDAPIDCNSAHILIPGAESCHASQRASTAVLRPRVFYEDTGVGAECVFDRESARTGGGNGFVKLVWLRPDADVNCRLSGKNAGTLNHMRSISRIVAEAADLSYPTLSGDHFEASFTAPDRRTCRAFVVLGPVVMSHRRRDDSRAYRIDGYLCAPPGAALGPTEVATFVASIRVRTD